MYKKTILILVLLLGIKGVSQENYNSESYQVTLGDLEAKTFTKDSTANAIVIYEKGRSFVDRNDFDLRTEEKYKIKILNRVGFENATVKILLYNNKAEAEKVKNITATTYNKNGHDVITTKLDPENIFEENYDENHTLVKFTLPNIKVGSVITYSFTTISPFMFKYHGWEFQSHIPKLYSQYDTSIPGYWTYHIKMVGGTENLAINTSDIEKNCLKVGGGGSANCLNSVYAMKNIPAFLDEDYMTSKKNYLARVDYELQTFTASDGNITDYSKTWKDVDKELKTDKEIGKQLRKSIDIEAILSTDIISEPNNLKKAEAIYKYVQNNYRWNNDYNIFKNVSIKDLLENKSGNVSAINILLHNLLLESNIEVKPVLVSTRNNGFPTKIYPVISDFNYLLVQATINNKKYLLDATDAYLNFGDIPFRCLNDQGRLLDFKAGSSWVDLKPESKSQILYYAKLHFENDGTLSGQIKSKRTGYHALQNKKSYYNNENGYLKNLENNYPYINISNFEITSDNKTSKDFKESYNVTYNLDNVGSHIYINPFLVKFFKNNPFKLQERTYPIDFGYNDSYFYSFKIDLGNNLEVLEIPKPQSIILPNNTAKLLINSEKLGNSVVITYKIDFKSFYTPDYYPYLKAFMSKIIDLQTNALLVLKKTS